MRDPTAGAASEWNQVTIRTTTCSHAQIPTQLAEHSSGQCVAGTSIPDTRPHIFSVPIDTSLVRYVASISRGIAIVMCTGLGFFCIGLSVKAYACEYISLR